MTNTHEDAACREAENHLITVRDWLRYGTSRFTEASLVFGHGTVTAQDEAAYLILHALHLPVDEIEPWLEARLLPAERHAVSALFAARLSSRKPAPYLTHEAYMLGVRFYVDERVIIPRSFIGTLLQDSLSGVITSPDKVRNILDLCTGSGCLAVLAARAFPRARIDAADISPDALEVARRNVREHGLEARIRLLRSDLFANLQNARYDLILANPPYVTEQAMKALPPEYRYEPALALAGGADGLDAVRRILETAGAHLTPEGWLVMEIGAGRERLESAFPALPFLWLETELSEGEVFALPAAAFPAEHPL